MVEHTGSRSGYGSYIRMVPSRKMGVVVLANRTGVSLPRTTEAAIVAALGPLPAAEPVVAAGAVEVVDIAGFVGTYSQGARTMAVVNRDGKLFLRQGTSETAMEHVDQRTFRAGTTSYIFVVNSSGAVTFLHSGGRSWRKIK